MKKFGGIATCVAAAIALQAAPVAADPEVRESEYELPAAEAWQQEGFRIQLRFGTESLAGVNDGGPSGSGWAIAVEPGVRLSRLWSLSANLRYSVLSEEMAGLRWSTTADVSFHPWGGLFLAVGAGYGGLLAKAWSDTGDWGGCQGHAAVALGRLGWLFAVGEIFATGPVVQFDVQTTRCGEREEGGSYVEGPDGDRWVADRSSVWWTQRTLNLSWSVAWR